MRSLKSRVRRSWRRGDKMLEVEVASLVRDRRIAPAAPSKTRDLRGLAGLAGVAFFAVAIIVAGILIKPPNASALPSFARQTGQPCATCHTAFPQLTPYGRRFKLSGYTLGGGMTLEQAPPIAMMVIGSFTHTGVNQDAPPAPWTHTNNSWLLQQLSLFYGGQIWGNLGGFIQAPTTAPPSICFSTPAMCGMWTRRSFWASTSFMASTSTTRRASRTCGTPRPPSAFRLSPRRSPRSSTCRER